MYLKGLINIVSIGRASRWIKNGGRIGSRRYGLGDGGYFLVIRCKFGIGFGVGGKGWGIKGGRISVGW